jgi:hypothetical protein
MVDITLSPRYILGSYRLPLFLYKDEIRSIFQSDGTPQSPTVLNKSYKHATIFGDYKDFNNSGEIKLFPHDLWVFKRLIPLDISSAEKMGGVYTSEK